MIPKPPNGPAMRDNSGPMRDTTSTPTGYFVPNAAHYTYTGPCSPLVHSPRALFAISHLRLPASEGMGASRGGSALARDEGLTPLSFSFCLRGYGYGGMGG